MGGNAEELDPTQGIKGYFWSQLLRQWEEGFGTYSSTPWRADSQHLHRTKEDAQRLFTLEFCIIFPMGNLCTNNSILLIWRVFLFFSKQIWISESLKALHEYISFIICINRSSHQVSSSLCCLFQQDGYWTNYQRFESAEFIVPTITHDLGKGSEGS